MILNPRKAVVKTSDKLCVGRGGFFCDIGVCHKGSPIWGAYSNLIIMEAKKLEKVW